MRVAEVSYGKMFTSNLNIAVQILTGTKLSLKILNISYHGQPNNQENFQFFPVVKKLYLLKMSDSIRGKRSPKSPSPVHP